MSGQLQGKIALITGASRGIGAAIAKRFAAEGAQLVLVARTVGGLEETDDAVFKISGKHALLVPTDLTKFDAIDQLGAALYERFGKLDILVGNAASLGVLGPIAQSDPKIFDATLALNLTANYRLIRSLDPLLRQSENPRALFVTSGVTKGVHPHWNAYAVSKIALEMLANLYREEATHPQLKVSLLDPGAVATGMRAEAFPGEDAKTLNKPDDITDMFVKAAA